MTGSYPNSAYARVITELCAGVLTIILIAGLWPFRAPKNDVTWLDGEPGIRFGRHGSILSSEAFRLPDSSSQSTGSLEVWLTAARTKGRRTILVFEGSGSGATISLQQSGDKLIVQRRNIDQDWTARTAEISVEGALPAKKPVFVTVTFAGKNTSIYLDGVLTKTSEFLGRPTATLTGRIVLGNSLSASDSWSGLISGLAIYDRQLTRERVLTQYEQWVQNHRPTLTQDEQPAALYLFNERQGGVVHNQVSSATDLTIPERYFVLQRGFLSTPMRYNIQALGHWKDVGINIIGFIPFGFVFAAYFSSVRPLKHPLAKTVLLGFLVSLTIEVLQAYLPTRDSGMNDLITNTSGTGIGVWLYRSRLAESYLNKICLFMGNSGSKRRGSIEVRTSI